MQSRQMLLLSARLRDAPRSSGPLLLHGICFGVAVALSACAVGSVSNELTTDIDAGTDPDAGSADAGPSFEAGPPPDSASPDAPANDTSLPDAGHKDAAKDTSPTESGACASGFSGVLVTFDLSSQPGNETSAAPTASAAGVTGSAMTRSAALTATTGAGSMNSSGWPMTVDPTRYYKFTVSPPAGCSVTLTSLALDVHASSTGPSTGDVATSMDNFAAHRGAFASTGTANVSLTGVNGAGAIEIRVYGYGASSIGGTFRIQNTMTVSGVIN